MTTQLEVRRLHPEANLPTRAHPTDAGLDLYALPDGDSFITDIPAWSSKLVGTGIAVSIPKGNFGYIRSRSGLASKENLEVGAGVVDSEYTGELRVLLRNHSERIKWVKAGDRVAQLLILPVPEVTMVEVRDFSEVDSDRGDGGFGSSGR